MESLIRLRNWVVVFPTVKDQNNAEEPMDARDVNCLVRSFLNGISDIFNKKINGILSSI